MHVSPLPWDPVRPNRSLRTQHSFLLRSLPQTSLSPTPVVSQADFDKQIQSVHGRSDRPQSGWQTPIVYADWEHFGAVQPKLLGTTAQLLERLENRLGPQNGSNRTCAHALLLAFAAVLLLPVLL